MDENPYKAPDEQGAESPAKHSEFLDPVRNAISAVIVLVFLALAFIVGMIKAGALRF